MVLDVKQYIENKLMDFDQILHICIDIDKT